MQEAALEGSRDVVQLHFGGGTPTFLSEDEMQRLMDIIRKHFRLLPRRRIFDRSRSAQGWAATMSSNWRPSASTA
jgi:hypothetical protein